jgi:ribosomal protein S18 acetylase RimI-like enzyme
MPLPEMIRIDEQDWEKRRALLADGWREIEVLETYGTRHGNSTLVIRPADGKELSAICDVAIASLSFDRLHQDETVSKEAADLAKVQFILDAFGDPEKIIYVHGHPVNAFLIVTQHSWAKHHMTVNLVAVAPEMRKRGLAAGMIEKARRTLGAFAIDAGTQMHNEPAKKLYESLGMSVVKRERTFHK